MYESKQKRIDEEPFPHGARLVWSEKQNKLILQVPKGASRPPSSTEPESVSTSIIDKVLAGKAATG